MKLCNFERTSLADSTRTYTLPITNFFFTVSLFVLIIVLTTNWLRGDESDAVEKKMRYLCSVSSCATISTGQF
jgi:hypothetical protein